MRKLGSISAMALVLACGAAVLPAIAHAQSEATVQVGGAPMFPSRNIIQNAIKSKDHTTLVAAVKAAGLVETLESAGPFTVFAPVNSAFDHLPEGTVANLLKPENKATLTAVLTYHVVAGKLSRADLLQQVKDGGGSATLKTVQGGSLTVTNPDGKHLKITDASGDVASITIGDVNQSNGVIHVIDTVLLPK